MSAVIGSEVEVAKVLSTPDGLVDLGNKLDYEKGAANFQLYAKRLNGNLETWIGQNSDPAQVQNAIALHFEGLRNGAFEAAEFGVCHAVVGEWVRMPKLGLRKDFIAEMEHIPRKYREMQQDNSGRLTQYRRLSQKLASAKSTFNEADSDYEAALLGNLNGEGRYTNLQVEKKRNTIRDECGMREGIR